MLYRLATSPGRRALLGLRPRRGALVRPLLALRPRARCGRLASEAGLPFRDDPTNAEPLYARNRIRNEVLPVLREIGPAAEETIAETQAELAEEGEALEALAAEALVGAGADAARCDQREALAGLRSGVAPARAAAAGRARARPARARSAARGPRRSGGSPASPRAG